MNTMLVYDATLFSDDSYYAQMNDNCFEEVFGLDTSLGNVNIDKLEI
jgi:hypothetical protein